jgi:membrane protein YdbS with pleckstrin-like domain
MEHVNPNTVPVWRWQSVLVVLVLSVPFSAVALRTDDGLILGAFGTFVFVALVCAWFVPPAYYRKLRFAIDEDGIKIERGVLWRSFTALPKVRVQHSDVSQGPLQRHFGVATLKLYTAGSRYTKVELPGLEQSEAIALRDVLLARGGDSGV